jgi:hypothetical protein
MADEKSMGPGAARFLTTHDEDQREQRAVLQQILEYHPAALTQDELTREMTSGGSTAFADVDAVARAVRELSASGLLHRPGEDEMVRPTRAALRYFELTNGGF